MGQVSIRLDRDLERKVQALRAEGVAVSEVMRDAINTEYSRRCGGQQGADIEAVLADLRRDHPTPKGYRSPGIDTTSRRAVQTYIRSSLQQKHHRIARAAKRRRA